MDLAYKLKLNDGNQIPICGLGTSRMTDVENNIYEAIKLGVRLIDTAKRYKNEKEIGVGINRAIKEGIVKREELFIVSKLFSNDYECPEETLKNQLADLGLEYIDLYLVHMPVPTFDKETNKFKKISIISLWRKFEEFQKKGLVKSLGVSNFNIQGLISFINEVDTLPTVNEVELHPYMTQEPLRKICKLYNIHIIAYNSLVKGTYVFKKEDYHKYDILNEPLIIKLSEKYLKSPAQIVLSWAISQGIITIPRSSNPKRILENLQSTEFMLSATDIDEISKLNENKRFCESTYVDEVNNYDIFG